MFGYVRPQKSELLVREDAEYRAVYCALCKELGKSFGLGARFILSYDCTFYAMLALAVSDSQLQVERKRCTTNPMKRCMYLPSEGTEYQKAAALSVIMTYHKCKDNIADEGFFKSLKSRLGVLFLSGKYKKAKKMYPAMEETVSLAMKRQQEAEQDETASLDRCCDPTAKMLSALFAELAAPGDPGAGMALSEFGYYLGRWIYIMDAADDLQEDLQAGAFNPFIKMLSLEACVRGGKIPFDGEIKKETEAVCNEVLNRNIAMMIPAFHLLTLNRFEAILDNIVKKGLPEIQREYLFLHIKEKRNGRSV